MRAPRVLPAGLDCWALSSAAVAALTALSAKVGVETIDSDLAIYIFATR
jgi:uncharacterized membrane protein